MNHILFTSSLLFILPIIIALKLGIRDVAITSALCLVTSLASYYFTEYTFLKTIDIFVVNSIATIYTLHSIVSIFDGNKFNPLYSLVVGLAIATLAVHFRWGVTNDFGQLLVHVLAVAGIVVYICARHFHDKSSTLIASF